MQIQSELENVSITYVWLIRSAARKTLDKLSGSVENS